jgi:RNA polymerase sigma-70 factor, ECF subfamily
VEGVPAIAGVHQTETGVSGPATASDRTEDLAEVFADPNAFRRWYDAAVVRVYGYLHSRCGGDVALAEELTQQTFIQAVRHWQSFDGRSDAVTWLCSIARNKLVDHFRELDRQERRHLRLVVREIPVAGGVSVEKTVADREAIAAALRGLPALQRAALILRHVDDLSVREVASIIGRSEDATESLLRRARDRFRVGYPEDRDG